MKRSFGLSVLASMLISTSVLAEHIRNPTLPLATTSSLSNKLVVWSLNEFPHTVPSSYGLLQANPQNAQLYCISLNRGFIKATAFTSIDTLCSGPIGGSCFATTLDRSGEGYVLENIVIGKQISIAKIENNGVRNDVVISSIDCE